MRGKKLVLLSSINIFESQKNAVHTCRFQISVIVDQKHQQQQNQTQSSQRSEKNQSCCQQKQQSSGYQKQIILGQDELDTYVGNLSEDINESDLFGLRATNCLRDSSGVQVPLSENTGEKESLLM